MCKCFYDMFNNSDLDKNQKEQEFGVIVYTERVDKKTKILSKYM